MTSFLSRRKFIILSISSIGSLQATFLVRRAGANDEWEARLERQRSQFLENQAAASDAFEESQAAARADYLKRYQAAVDAFEQRYREASANYAKQVKATWGEREGVLRTPSRWVDYDRNIKRVMDFANNTIEISVITDRASSPQKAKRLLLSQAQSLVTESPEQLLEKDPVESALRRSAKTASVKTAKQKRPQRSPAFAVATYNKRDAESTKPVSTSLANGKTITKVKIPFKGTQRAKRNALLPIIQRHCNTYRLDPALVSAIIQAESSFNPLAQSHIPAFGLMQIVPRSAGRDVSEYLYKEATLLSPRWLYDPDNNILAGCTYLHILSTRYLKGIRDKRSREYCVIASYNTGAGNMARAFSKYGLNAAIEVINQLSPADVKQRLLQNLPYVETKNYLKKVTRYKSSWENTV